jgi:hypothetical protein
MSCSLAITSEKPNLSITVAHSGWSFCVEVVGYRGEEPSRHRDQPLPTALAVSDEHPPLGDPKFFRAQPENLAAPQPPEHHRRGTP